MDSDALAAFAVFAERLNFTRAAEELAISQPALHVKVGKLARSLGVPLYRREGRRLLLTAEGREVQAFAREMGERSRTFLDQLHRGRLDQPVLLAAGEGVYLYLLGAAVLEFVERGSAPLRLLTRDREGTVEAIRSGEAHLGVAALEDSPDGVVAERLVDVDMVVAMPDGHPLSRKRRVRLKDLAGERLVVPPPGRPHRTVLERAILAAGVEWQPGVEATGWELMLHFCRLGLGLAVVNGCCRLPPELVARPVPELPRIPYFLLSRRGTPLLAAAEDLAGVIRDKIAA